MSDKIGFLKGEVISVDDESVLVRVEDIGKSPVKVGDAYLLITPAEQSEITKRYSDKLHKESARAQALESTLDSRNETIAELRGLLQGIDAGLNVK